MKSLRKNWKVRHKAEHRKGSAGIAMFELLVSLAIFLVVAGTAMTLFQQHARMFNDQQNQIGLNITLRNAVTQMQTDLVNAGTGYYATADISSSPIGVSITNATGGTACHAAGTTTYAAACFDTLNIIVPDPTVLPGQPSACTLTTSGAMTLTPPTGTTGAQLTTMANGYTSGSYVLFMHSQQSGVYVTASQLTANATVVGSTINIAYHATAASGVSSYDLGLTQNDQVLADHGLGDQFCNGTDWVVKLAPIVYSVNTANANDPQLFRTESGVANLLADQIVGFRVGASTDVSGNVYNFNIGSPATYETNQVRSICISLIGRSNPTLGNGINFTNTFDGGRYKVESVSVVVDPRNLSMN